MLPILALTFLGACTLPGYNPDEEESKDPFIAGRREYIPNDPPSLTPLAETPITVRERDPIEIQLAASDPEGDPLTYGVSFTDLDLREIYQERWESDYRYQYHPHGANLNSTTGLFTWEPPCNSSRRYQIRFWVKDQSNDSIWGTNQSTSTTVEISNRCATAWWKVPNVFEGEEIDSQIAVGEEEVFAIRIVGGEGETRQVVRAKWKAEELPPPGISLYLNYEEGVDPQTLATLEPDGSVEQPDGQIVPFSPAVEMVSLDLSGPEKRIPEKVAVYPDGSIELVGFQEGEDGSRHLWFGRANGNGTFTLNKTYENLTNPPTQIVDWVQTDDTTRYLLAVRETEENGSEPQLYSMTLDGSLSRNFFEDLTEEELPDEVLKLVPFNEKSLIDVGVFGRLRSGLWIGLFESTGSKTSTRHYPDLDLFVLDAKMDTKSKLLVAGYEEELETKKYRLLKIIYGNGEIEWNQTEEALSGEIVGTRLALDNKDNIYLTGYAITPEGQKRAVLRHFDSDGNLIWSEPEDGLAETDFIWKGALPLPLEGDQWGSAVIFDDLSSQLYVMGTEGGTKGWIRNYLP